MKERKVKEGKMLPSLVRKVGGTKKWMKMRRKYKRGARNYLLPWSILCGEILRRKRIKFLICL